MAPVANAQISVRNEQTGGKRVTHSDSSGLYSVFSLSPGVYRIAVHAAGFETVVREGIRLSVADNARLDFSLQIGDVRTVVIVKANSDLMSREEGSVGTVIDRTLIDKLPLNGRGIQALIELSPGVVVSTVTDLNRGQFVVNGQRSDTNYFTVDGMSANFAAGDPRTDITGNYRVSSVGQSTGALPALGVLGNFSSLVSPEALQEFKIQTSSYAPEFGFTPGAQIELVTRSGTNRYSGSLFEYFRNEHLDASDWFNNELASPKAPLRFNDFGGTLGGPIEVPGIYHGQTFFFFSFEDALVRQPQPAAELLVPSEQARAGAPSSLAPLLNAFPLPNRPVDSAAALSGLGEFIGAYSLKNDQQSTGLRVDHSFGDRLTLFARYNYAPSFEQGIAAGNPSNNSFAASANNPANIEQARIDTQSFTFGLTQILRPSLVNETRANIGTQKAPVGSSIRAVGGAQVPAQPFSFFPPYSPADTSVVVAIGSLPRLELMAPKGNEFGAHQLQFVDNLSYGEGAHLLKFGVDYRRSMTSQTDNQIDGVTFSGIYGPTGLYGKVASDLYFTSKGDAISYLIPSFSAYIQDTWRMAQTITVTYGIRWEVAPAPSVIKGQAYFIRGVTNLNDLNDPYELPAPSTERSPYSTDYLHFAPRAGLAWMLHNGSIGRTVLRGGAGVFYDLGRSGFADSNNQSLGFTEYANVPVTGRPSGPPAYFDNGNDEIANTPIIVAPGHNLPRTYQWNLTMEQSLGAQTFSVGYVGALGRRLAGSAAAWDPLILNTAAVEVLGNNASSSYNALQLHFNRRLSKRVQALISYSWSHAIDNVSDDLPIISLFFPTVWDYLHPETNRGSSDFDIRNSFNGAIVVDFPSPHGRFDAALFGNWSANSIFFARTAPPIDLLTASVGISDIRPDLVPGEPLFLYGRGLPGGKAVNPAAFSTPPADANEGTLGRNVLRGFGAWEIDLALHRTVHLSERTDLQFRAEAFNVLNHPNFANPYATGTAPYVLLPGDGRAMSTLASGLGQQGAPGQLNPLFQIGGPRSMQLALRLSF